MITDRARRPPEWRCPGLGGRAHNGLPSGHQRPQRRRLTVNVAEDWPRIFVKKGAESLAFRPSGRRRSHASSGEQTGLGTLPNGKFGDAREPAEQASEVEKCLAPAAMQKVVDEAKSIAKCLFGGAHGTCLDALARAFWKARGGLREGLIGREDPCAAADWRA